MTVKRRLERLEARATATAPPVDREVLLAQVIARLDAFNAGEELPPGDRTDADPVVAAYRAALLRRMESRSHD